MPFDIRRLISICESLLHENAGGSVVNNLGKPIAATPEGLNNFLQWFGRSKAIDTQGRPLVLYHGTKADFDSFDPTKCSSFHDSPAAYFFTSKPDVAQSYAKQTTHPLRWKSDADAAEHLRLMQAGEYEKAEKLSKTGLAKNVKTWGESANVMPVYLRMMKPLRVSGQGNHWNEIWYDSDYRSTTELVSIAASKGYDSAIIKNVHDRGEGKGKPSTIYVVFSPNQIKSAIGNKGSFAMDNNSITESMRKFINLCESRLPEDVVEAFEQLGDMQRGSPEMAMLRVQATYLGGVLNPVVEHLGDVTHRMTELVRHDTVLGYEKVVKVLRWLNSGYGFEREMKENIKVNAQHREITPEQMQEKIGKSLRKYAEEHAKLPVYNKAQWLARQAAILVGLENFDGARRCLQTLVNYCPDEDTFVEKAMEFHRNPDGSLQHYSPSTSINEAKTGPFPIPATPENITMAKEFVLQKWKERAKERGMTVDDLSSSCNFSSLFAQKIFGGKIQGNYDHQYVVLNGRVIDLNADAEDVRNMSNPHCHDKRFWNNKDHKESMKSCLPRVAKWVEEFTGLITND